MFKKRLTALLCCLLPASLSQGANAKHDASSTPLTRAAGGDTKPAPTLIVAISVDQFSADLFAEYRGEFTGGLRRLQQGAVFPAGYQAHAATETCPGHSTILTGNHPTRTGIYANSWIDLQAKRSDKTVYCAENENVPGSNSSKYTVSDIHLKVPTLGERMKAANPYSRVVSVAGKDRSAVMMGGRKVDELWWWDGKRFSSYAGRKEPAAVTRANQRVLQLLSADIPAKKSVPFCDLHSRAIPIGKGKNVGQGAFALKKEDIKNFISTPYFDDAVFLLSGDLIEDMNLGKGQGPDIISIGASATDYVGHTYGTSGSEMCLNLMALDGALGSLFARIDRLGVDYAVVLTADHGGHDLPERTQQQAEPGASRISADLLPKALDASIAKKLRLSEKTIHGYAIGDVWFDKKLSGAQRFWVKRKAIVLYKAHPMVAAVLTRKEILKTKIAKSPPETWSIAERVRASYDMENGGDLYVALKPYVTPVFDPTKGTVATHGSVWDYDRRVPILFWRVGMARFEQPLPVMTVDIAPSLAPIIKIQVPPGEMDGRCLDLDASAASTCD
jgi:predicted AlkP superfamily pyrophosphatase or phosphodiesterase